MAIRIMYQYAAADVPVFLLTVFAKAKQANLSKAQRNALARVAKQIVDEYREGETNDQED